MRVLFHPGNPGFAINLSRIVGKASLPLQAANSIAGLRTQISATSVNVGNIIHNEAVAKTFQLDLQQSCMANIERLYRAEAKADKKTFQKILAKNYDAVVFSFANMIAPAIPGHEAQQAQHMAQLADITEAINVPLYVLGMGMQKPLQSADDIHPEQVRFLKAVNAKAEIFGVRGAHTETFLHKIGCTNAKALGCPSLYLYPDNIHAIEPLAYNSSLKTLTAGYLARRYLLGEDTHRLKALQKIGTSLDASYVFQNDLFTLQELEHVPHLYDDATGTCNGEILNLYFKTFGHDIPEFDFRLFRDPRAWRQFAATKDCFVGDRFHGGVVALQTGRPSLFLYDDLRVEELTNHFGIPSIPIDEFNAKSMPQVFETAFSKVRLDEMKETYEMRCQEYFSLAQECGLKPVRQVPRKTQMQPPARRGLLKDRKALLAARTLFENCDGGIELGEVVLTAMARGRATQKTVNEFVADWLAKNPAPFSEAVALRCGNLLARHRYHDAVIALYTAWKSPQDEGWTERSIDQVVHSLYALKRSDEAMQFLAKVQENTPLKEAFRRKMATKLGVDTV